MSLSALAASAWAVIKQPASAPERFVLAVGLVFGLFFVLAVPPMQGADEPNHFLRAYQVSELNLRSDYVGPSQGGIATRLQTFDRNVGGELPGGLVAFTWQAFDRLPTHPEEKMKKADWAKLFSYDMGEGRTAAAFANTAAYSPAAYAPQVLGIWLGRALSLKPIFLLYFARLFGLVAGMLILYLAVRLMPFGKPVFAVLALLPTTISQMSIAGADTLAVSLSFLVIALIFYYAERRSSMSRRDVAVLIGLFLLLGVVKQSLFPLSLAAVALLRNRRLGRRRAVGIAAGCVAASLLAVFTWNVLVKDSIVFGYHQTYVLNDYDAQLKFILTEPWNYARVLYESFLTTKFDYVPATFIGNMGWLDAPMPYMAVAFAFVLIGLTVFVVSQAERITIVRWQRGVFALAAAGVMVVSATVMYLLCNPPRHFFADGIQGRYFTPLAPLLAIVFMPGKGRLATKLYQTYVRRCLYASVVLLGFMAVVVCLRFYA